ncbi:LuxR family transcriptional regulator, partial [Kitasatospora sp. NPDC059571]
TRGAVRHRAHAHARPTPDPLGRGRPGAPGPAPARGPDRADASAQARDVLESLVYALLESGRLDRALALTETFPADGPGALDDARAAALRTRLAWAAVSAARTADAAAQVALVRDLLQRFDGTAHTPALDVVESRLVLGGATGDPAADDRTAEAERLARRAARRAEQHGQPVIACQAWQLLAVLERRHGFDRADLCLERILSIATRHALPIWRVDALLRLGVNAFMRDGSSSRLEQAHRAARELAAPDLVSSAEATLAMQAVLRGDYPAARELTGRCLESTARRRNVDQHQFALLTRAAAAAHQGRRAEMERDLAEFERWDDGAQSLQRPLVHGNCRAICALLEEERDLAARELDSALRWEEQNPTVFYLNGRFGLRLLLRAMDGTADPADHAAGAADHAAALAWNRQFERLAHAVHLGRAGRGAEAAEAV